MDTPRARTWTRMKQRWGVTGLGFFLVMLAFAITGFIVLKISSSIVNAIVPATAPKWLWWAVKLLVIVPIYELILVTVGTLLGQRRFFVDKQRRMLRVLARAFRGGREPH